jgi:hypothetical protein
MKGEKYFTAFEIWCDGLLLRIDDIYRYGIFIPKTLKLPEKF